MKGTLYFCQRVIPVMQKQGGGVIVNNSSMLGLAAEPFSGAYTATKFGVIGLTKVIAAEFGKDKIRCSAVCPGSVDTRMQDEGIAKFAEWAGTSPEQARADAERNALGRSAKPEEVADVIVWLASPMRCAARRRGCTHRRGRSCRPRLPVPGGSAGRSLNGAPGAATRSPTAP